jgi:hypothetical protein
MMNNPRDRAEAIARRYTGIDQLLKDLGSGAEGYVFASPSATAIKVFTHHEKFDRELAAYQRLLEHDVIDVLGFAVPRLVHFDANLLVIEMTMVQPPFLLDFAQSVLDMPLDFPEGLDEWWERIEPDFGDRFPIVQQLFYELQHKYGIYYYDLAPRNVNFGD